MRSPPAWPVAVVLFVAFLAGAQTTQTAPTPRATTVSTAPVEMDRDTLATIYARELGDKYDPAKLDSLIDAHRLIEDYFANPPERKSIVTRLVDTKIDPNILGRLTRVRMHWMELTPGVYYINERVGPHAVKYFLGIPKNYDRTKPWPLVIKLPAADAFVKEPRPVADQVVIFYRDWMADEVKRHPDAVVVMPLLNLDELYGPSYAGMFTVIQPMQHVADRVNIDPARVYLIGHSMSAHAVWNLALHYPMYFAAINALAGGASQDWQRLRMMNLRNVAAIVWHDFNDEIIKVQRSRDLVKIMRQMKFDVDYTETKKIGHVPTDEITANGYEKMFSRIRTLYPERITHQSNRPDSIFNRQDWMQIYQPLNAGDENWHIVSRGRGHFVVYSNTFKVDATRDHNRIDATTDNVASLRFCLNDQMVDFSKPVTVNVNRKGVFEAMVTPSVEGMLKDQLFIGRGWRYFTGIVDVELGPKPVTQPSTKR
ncbi:MAG: hypothetical protein H7Z14_12170 [Anaerolineae bacterium]|nr:hypothetical protein [Phycisphaerae bacterium]